MPQHEEAGAAGRAKPASRWRTWLHRADAVHRRRAWLAFPMGVAKKFGEDQAGQLAALIAYYAFFSLFPLLLLLFTVLGYALHGNPDVRDSIVDSTLAQFPVIGDQIRSNVGSIKGSGPGLVIGVLGALWG